MPTINYTDPLPEMTPRQPSISSSLYRLEAGMPTDAALIQASVLVRFGIEYTANPGVMRVFGADGQVPDDPG
jgi:hypothetical protein